MAKRLSRGFVLWQQPTQYLNHKLNIIRHWQRYEPDVLRAFSKALSNIAFF